MINLEKGQRFNLEKNNGSKLTNFCVGCNWGAIKVTEEKKGFLGFGKKLVTTVKDVDLDLSCLMFDEQGQWIDHLYSPLYQFSKSKLPKGKYDSLDGALHHSGDDLSGDTDGDDGLDNEIITVDLTKISPRIAQIFFFLNIYTPPQDRQIGKMFDFAQIPYASIRMYDGTPSKVREVYASYNIPAKPEYRGKQAIVMGKLYRRGDEWKFAAIGDAYDDEGIVLTMARIVKDYARTFQYLQDFKMRRLPVYLLLDTSGSMFGEPIEAVKNGVQVLVSTLRQDPYALETAYLSVITFDSSAQQICPLTELASFQEKDFEAKGCTALGEALELLSQRVDVEVAKTTAEVKGDWKPLVFIMTDGEPTDDLDKGLIEFKKRKFGMVVACAAGQNANTDSLKKITENVVSLDTADSATIKSFFKWVSASVSAGSMKVEDSGKDVSGLSELPPPPKEVNFVC